MKQYGDQAIFLYEQYIRSSPLMNDIEELRGKRLGCWCVGVIPYRRCHGEVLVKILNEKNRQWKYLTLDVIKQ